FLLLHPRFTLFPYTTLFRSQVLGVSLRREDDPGAALLLLEIVDRGLDRALEDIVREHHEDAVAAGKALGEPKRFAGGDRVLVMRSEEHTSELQSRGHLVCRL